MNREDVTKRWERWKNQRTYYKGHGDKEDSSSASDTKLEMMREIIGKIDRQAVNENKAKEIKLEN